MIRIPADHPRLAGPVDLVRRCIARVIELEFVDRSIALASLAFTSLIPLGVVLSTIVPGINQEAFADSLIHRFELDGSTAAVVRSAFDPPDHTTQSVSILGLLLLIGAALSFTRAIQRLYERAWRLPHLGFRATPAGLTWLVAVVAFGATFGGIRSSIVHSAGPVVAVIVALAFDLVVWLVSPLILLSRRVPWRPLVPTAVLTAVSMTALSIGSIIYMPHAIAESADRYGTIGVAIALVSWLVGAGFVIVCCAGVGVVLSEGYRPGADPPALAAAARARPSRQ